jgi:dTMP kinase
LRELLLGGRVAPFGAEAEALVFAIARADHLTEVIRPALRAGDWVVCDRFLDSTWAYQGVAGVTADVLARLDSIAVGADRPDLTFVLDLPAEIGLRRMRGRADAVDRFEGDMLEHHRARRAAFLDIARREPQRCVIIDAAAGERQVADAIRAAVEQRLGAGRAGAA